MNDYVGHILEHVRQIRSILDGGEELSDTERLRIEQELKECAAAVRRHMPILQPHNNNPHRAEYQ